MKAFTLTQLLLSVKKSLEQTFNGYYWITAETTDVRLAGVNAHCYLELIEKDPEGHQPMAKVRAGIWSHRYAYLSAKFIAATGSPIVSGIKVLVLVQLSMHPLFGLSLVIHDIDPAYTLGDLVRVRREVIERLKAEGIFALNASLPLPPLLQRLAVISAPNAAGYGDFIHQLQNNRYGICFYTALFSASMQGATADVSIVKALHRILDSGFRFDAVVIIRGGGASADLTAFDRYTLAEAVAQFPVPIFSGIGHERDKSVLDMVAHTSFKTPTAVADYLIQQMAEQLARINDTSYRLFLEASRHVELEFVKQERLFERLRNASLWQLEKNTHALRQARVGLQAAVLMNARLHRERREAIALMPQRLAVAMVRYRLQQEEWLEHIERRCVRSSTWTIASHMNRLEHLAQLVDSLHPKQVLKRGFSIVRCDGKAIKSADRLSVGDFLRISFAEGEASASVLSSENLSSDSSASN